jgi:hypothetical protein
MSAKVIAAMEKVSEELETMCNEVVDRNKMEINKVIRDG